MPSCRDIDPLLTAFVDEEATVAEHAAVRAHLQECAPCRGRASAEATARRLLRERAGALQVEAPAGLRARCQPGSPTTLFGSFARPVRVWATAAAVLAVFAAIFYAAGRGSTVLAAELALDHVKCFALFEKSAGPGDPATIAGRLHRSYGLTVSVPAGSVALGLRLMGGRRCFSTDGRVAHILYRHHGRPLSLFVLSGTTRAAEQLAVIGHEAIVWSHGGTSYVVLAREPRRELVRVADYVRRVVE